MLRFKRVDSARLAVAAKTALSNALVSRPFAAVVDAVRPTRLQSKGLSIRLPAGAVSSRARAMILFGFYEKAEIRFVQRYVKTGCDVIELGASLGVVSAHIAANMDKIQTLLSVEANPALRDIWTGVMQDHAPRALLVNAAIGPVEGDRTTFYVTPDPLCSHAGPVNHSSGQPIHVTQTTLSSLLERYQLGDGYFLVSDIEGGEAAFIVAPDTHALSLCAGMIIELHDTVLNGARYSWRDLREALLTTHGFTVQEEHGPVLALTRDSQDEK